MKSSKSRIVYLMLGAVLGLQLATCGPSSTSAEQPSIVLDAGQMLLPTPAFAKANVSGVKTPTLADVAKRVVPSVVNISAEKVSKVDRRNSPFHSDPFFKHFFGPNQMPKERRQKGLGSGVIVSSDGIVLTNNHVVESAEDIEVSLSNGKKYEAKIVGVDPKSDLAVLRLQGQVKGLTPITIGNSAAMRLGDVVLAIGNPFGVGQTVTMGIVSATSRNNVGIVDYEDFIQTDAAINPGNSGGALVNMKGELIGINTAILSRSGGYQGIGFAIPTNLAKPIMESLISDGKVVRGWLGVAIQDLNKELAQGLGLPVERGVLVSEVQDNSPAEKAGLKGGDVIVSIDGKPVASSSALRNLVAMAAPGLSLPVTIYRGKSKKTINVKLGELKSGAVAKGPQAPSQSKSVISGLSLSNLTKSLRGRFKVSKKTKYGVVVTAADPASKAYRAGIRPGDVIVAVNRKEVKNLSDLRRVLDQKSGVRAYLVHRQNAVVYLAF